LVARPHRSLFDADLPEGFRYQADFISGDEEASLAAAIAAIEFSTFEMRGVVARRRVAFFGASYDAGGMPTSPMPAFLLPLRDRIGRWTSRDPEAFAMALVNEYPPGAPIGWHRDAPQYDIVAGVSLLAPCRMKLRPYVRPSEQRRGMPRRTATCDIVLEPRSAYVMAGAARSEWQHSIPAVDALRYSVTFRTVRAASAR
jgi:alkylated DNA repair dioxygenase AlkB